MEAINQECKDVANFGGSASSNKTTVCRQVACAGYYICEVENRCLLICLLRKKELTDVVVSKSSSQGSIYTPF